MVLMTALLGVIKQESKFLKKIKPSLNTELIEFPNIPGDIIADLQIER